LRWDEIEKVESNGYWIVVTGKSGKMRISLFVADSGGLVNEIKEKTGQECVRNGNAF
jgi:hypothetical protein